MEPFSLPIPAPPLADDYEGPFSDPPSPVRARAPPSEHIQVIRELWVLRERGAVRALEPDFLMRLALLLGGGVRVREARREDASWVRASRPSSENDEPNIPVSEGPVPVPGIPRFVEASRIVREPPLGTSPDVDAARAQQRVTGLSPSFRARLEGMEDVSQARSPLQRTDSWDDLNEQRAVTNALESAFRHELEGVLVRRGTRNDTRLYARPQRYGERHLVERNLDHDHDVVEFGEAGNHDTMHGRERPSNTAMAIHTLREEVAALKQMMDANFDVSLDIQRSVRQEVAAALNAHTHSGKKRLAGAAHGNNNGNSNRPEVATIGPSSVRPFNGGTCSICLDRQVDSMLYSCGHMTCTPCGRQLLAHGENCHVCRAPVRDVVRCFFS